LFNNDDDDNNDDINLPYLLLSLLLQLLNEQMHILSCADALSFFLLFQFDSTTKNIGFKNIKENLGKKKGLPWMGYPSFQRLL
jgi:hypothetical protein